MDKVLSLPIVGMVLLGCATPPPVVYQAEPAPLNVRLAPDIGEGRTTTRTSRYVTESATPDKQVRDVLSTIIKVDIPVITEPSIGEGMSFLLARTGYKLREPLTYGESQLYHQPLPLVQTNMGHMSVRQGLQVMAGDVWQLEENVVKRELGFVLKPRYTWDKPLYSRAGTSSQSESRTTELVSLQSEHTGYAASVGATSISGARSSTTNALSQTKAKPSSANAADAGKYFPPVSLHTVNRGETYHTALSRWLRADGIKDIAWAEDSKLLDALQLSPSSSFVHRGTLTDSVEALVSKVPELNDNHLNVLVNRPENLAAVHPWSYRSVIVLRVSGDTLRQAVRNLVHDYDWLWIDEGFQGASWTSSRDYAFSATYPIVAPTEDISMALSIVLRQYPVVAQVLGSAKQIFVVEDNR